METDASLYITRDENSATNDVHLSVACIIQLPDNGNGGFPGETVATAVFDILYQHADLHTNPGNYGFPTANVNDLAAPGTVAVELKNKPAFMEAYDYEGRLYKDAEAQAAAWTASPVDEGSVYFKQNFTTKGTDSVYYAKDVTYLVSSPVTFQVSLDEYYSIVSGEAFDWSKYQNTFSDANPEEADKRFGLYKAVKNSAFLMLNTSRSIVNDKFEGYYFGLTDNMFVSPSDDYTYNAVDTVKITTKTMAEKNNPAEAVSEAKGLLDNIEGTGDFDTLSALRLGFPLTGGQNGTVSKVLERSCSAMDTSTTAYDDTLSLALLKLNNSTTDAQTMKLNYTLREKFNAAFGKTRMKSTSKATKPVSYFVENIVADGSNNLGIMVNPFISTTIRQDNEGVLRGKMRVFGTKLVENLDAYEAKYTVKELAKKLSTSTNPIALARTFLSSYQKLIAQAGVSPQFLHTNFQCSTAETSVAHADFQKCDSIYPVGTYQSARNTTKVIGNLPYKLERALQLVKNDEEYPDCDIVVDGGLSTIYPYANGNKIIGNESDLLNELPDVENWFSGEDDETLQKQKPYVDTVILQGIEDMRTGKATLTEDAQSVIEDWKAVQDVFLNFCNSQANGGRGDSFFVGDLLRGILVKGKNTKVESLYGSRLQNNAYSEAESVNHSWATSIYHPVKHLTEGVVSSYAAYFNQWIKVDDVYSGNKIWLPSSPDVAAALAAVDVSDGPWVAAAGEKRGVITDALDIAVSPDESQRTDCYKLCVNSIYRKPRSGVTIWGIRTMSKQECVFDQIPCRRTFLHIEKKLKGYLRYYIFDPNTSYTRLSIYNDIFPFMENLRTKGAIYSFTIVCDETNNTAEIIDNGDLVCDVAAAPTRTAENIILNAIAQKYSETTTISSSL